MNRDNGLASSIVKARPKRYRSTTTGRYVSEEFAREHPGETRAVSRKPSAPLAIGALAVVAGLGLTAAAYRRARR